MKCPICGQQLRPGRKIQIICCVIIVKRNLMVPQQNKEAEPEQKYSNIPPKKVREKRETEMRKAYDDLLSIEDEKKKKKAAPKPKKRQDYDDYDDYDDVYDDEPMSKAPIIILAIAIVVVAGVIAYMLLK